MNKNIFRAYDIRGIAHKDFDSNDAYNIGRAFVTYLCKKFNLKNPKICVGRDGRLSGEEMKKSFISGCLDSGAIVTDLELSTSPLVFFSTCFGEFDGSVNITASHNPKEYNGFKLQSKNSHSICGDELQEIRYIIEKNDFTEGKGSLNNSNFYDEYKNKLLSFSGEVKNFKIVIDTGNGIAGKFARNIFESLGCEVISIYEDLDGSFPNHDADPEVEENLEDLKKEVIKNNANLGIAFDGDGDRVGFVDEKGKFYSSDLIMILLSRDLLNKHKNAKVVLDLKSTKILFDEIKKLGGEAIMVQTGHSFVEQKMKETGALLGGEVSGHMFFADNYYGFDDAFLAAIKIINILSSSKKTISEHLMDLPKIYNTPEIKIECDDDKKFLVVEKLQNYFLEKYGTDKCIVIDGVRVDFDDGSWGIVRASNTSPKLTMRFEANEKSRLLEIEKEFRIVVESYLG